jgi:hypothetical protein
MGILKKAVSGPFKMKTKLRRLRGADRQIRGVKKAAGKWHSAGQKPGK